MSNQLNPIVANLVSEMVKRQLKDYPPTDLEDFAFAIQYIYRYVETTEDRYELKKFYKKICEWVNSNKLGAIDPSNLEKFDRLKKRVEVM